MRPVRAKASFSYAFALSERKLTIITNPRVSLRLPWASYVIRQILDKLFMLNYVLLEYTRLRTWHIIFVEFFSVAHHCNQSLQ